MKLFMRAKILAVAVATAAFVAPSLETGTYAQEAPAKVESSISAYTVTLAEDGKEIKVPAKKVSPGGTIEYQLSYKNISDEPLEEFVILGNVPASTSYLSAVPLEATRAIFEVSVSDIGWATPPIVRYKEDDSGIMRPVEVPKDEFEALRWRLAEPISPGEEVSATYRIKVEE